LVCDERERELCVWLVAFREFVFLSFTHFLLGGGFAPVCKDGYGVSYVVCEERLWYHTTSFQSSKETSSSAFNAILANCLLDMHEVMLAKEGLITSASTRKQHVIGEKET